jgi:hypothetical protein
LLTNPSPKLLTKFFQSRRQGLSPRTLEFYQEFLTKASNVVVGIVVGSSALYRSERKSLYIGTLNYRSAAGMAQGSAFLEHYVLIVSGLDEDFLDPS